MDDLIIEMEMIETNPRENLMTREKTHRRLSIRTNPTPKQTGLWVVFVVTLVLIGCDKAKLPSITLDNIVYKIDIQQGNVITEEMLSKLQRGMDKRRVRFILGTPSIIGAFNPDRWDYIYSFQKGGGVREQRRISLFFRDDKLHHIEGNVIKAKQEEQPLSQEKDTGSTP
uniref:Outer membrane protein assembly factor BamE n=1 Tax=Candidatus Kentrum sp. MB TaxID=2138164 RepID=A0A450Y003_9GAMM|nr:MAG: outer membrane protein assembly factor BamE [Candidatus Kentron sp. MB]VFK34860.1 MAG: outer membrane protein assembly factor BamE [Candidatus Kentron sp. MB]VFK77009.1 MAG: outer membrane protein assembly factor BamE [Candidatus Kentron sp. MB]